MPGRNGSTKPVQKWVSSSQESRADLFFLFASPYLDYSLKCGSWLPGWLVMDWFILCLIGSNGEWQAVGWCVCVSVGGKLSDCGNSLTGARSALTQPAYPISAVPSPGPTGRLLLVEISEDGAFGRHKVNCRTPVVLNRGSAPGSITVSWKVEEP